MVRPIKGERAKKAATITVDPVQWKDFQDNVKAFLPDPSASHHVGTLIQNENARFAGKDGAASPAVSEAMLQTQQRILKRKYQDIEQILIRDKAVSPTTSTHNKGNKPARQEAIVKTKLQMRMWKASVVYFSFHEGSTDYFVGCLAVGFFSIGVLFKRFSISLYFSINCVPSAVVQ